MRWLAAAAALWAAGCVEVICAVPDGGCPPAPDYCRGVRAGESCAQYGASCGCCTADSPRCDLLGCGLQDDGGLGWYAYSGTPPQQCQ